MTHTQTSYFHRGGLEPLLGATIPEQFADVVKRFPDHEAVVSVHQNRRLSYAQLARAIDLLARGLAGIGFNKGDRIAIWSTNNIEWLLLQMATARIGAVLVNMNPAYRSREVAYALQRSEVQCLFMIPSFRTSDYVSMLVELIPELKDGPPGRWKSKAFPALRDVIVYNPSAADQTERPQAGFLTWQEVLTAADRVTEDALQAMTALLDRDDPINIQYTSGTTGFPKAVVLTHHNILNNAYFSALAIHFKETDRLVVPVPFYHCFGMVVSNLLCLSVGACLVIPCEHFDAEQVLQAVERERGTALHGVPTMFIAELEHPDFDKFDLSSLRTGIMAGSPCPTEVMKRVVREMNMTEITIAYGQTEASPVITQTRTEDPIELRVSTVGRALPDVEVKIVDIETGVTLPPGKQGELCGRGYLVMKGYYKMPEETAKVIDADGWLHTGDLAVMDENGYCKITGRIKNMIIRGGENIYPREIEEFLYTHPKISDVQVYGVPDRKYGEQVMAAILLKKGMDATADEVRDFCRGKIANYKVPKYVKFVDSYPMTASGKIQKFKLREMAIRELLLEAEVETA